MAGRGEREEANNLPVSFLPSFLTLLSCNFKMTYRMELAGGTKYTHYQLGDDDPEATSQQQLKERQQQEKLRR